MLEPDELRRWERNLRALLRQAADQDPEGLAEIVQLLDRTLRSELREAVRAMREQHGYSWDDIARAMGVTRQSAWERFGKTYTQRRETVRA